MLNGAASSTFVGGGKDITYASVNLLSVAGDIYFTPSTGTNDFNGQLFVGSFTGTGDSTTNVVWNEPASDYTMTASGFVYIWTFSTGTRVDFTLDTGTLILDGAADQNFYCVTPLDTGNYFNNVTISNTGATGSDNIVANTCNIKGNLAITDCDLDLNTWDTTINLTGNLTVSGSGMMDTTDSTFNFVGTTDQTITPNGQSFNHFTVNNTGSLGSDDIIISGALDTNGNLTLTDGDFDSNTNDPNVTLAGNFSVGSAGSWDRGSGTFTLDGSGTQTYTDSSGTHALGNIIVNGSSNTLALGSNATSTYLHIHDAETFAPGAYTLTLNNGTGTTTPLDILGTFTRGTSRIIYKGTNSSATTTVAAETYYALEIDSAENHVLGGITNASSTVSNSGAGLLDTGGYNLHADGTLTNAGTLNAHASNISTAGNWANSGTFNRGTSVVTMSAGSGTKTIATNGNPFYALTLNDGGGSATFQLQDILNASSTLSITGGMLDANGQTMNLSGNFTNADTFTHNSNTVTLGGTSQTISGSNTFYNLTKTVTVADTLTFTAGTTQTIENTTTLTGASGQLLSLRSSLDGSVWTIDPQGTRTISYVDVKDSTNANATAIDCTASNCTNSTGNTNWTFATVVEEEEEQGGGGGGGGGGIVGLFGSIFNPFSSTPPPLSSPSIPTPQTPPTVPIIDTVTDTVTDIIDKLPFFGEDEKEKPQLTDEFLDESPVFDNVWSLLDAGKLTDFTLAPLPDAILRLADKFPAFKLSLQNLGITRLEDFDQLKGATFDLGTLTALGDIPSEVVFTRAGNNLIDFATGLAVRDDGTVEQTIRTISGKDVEFVVKPKLSAREITGYLVLKKGGRTAVDLPLSLQLAGALFANDDAPGKTSQIEKIDNELLLLEFPYADADADGDGIYTARIAAPLASGTYEVITVIDYENPANGSREMRFVLLVDPEGYVYEKSGGKEIRIPNVTVTIFVKNTNTESFIVWDAGTYSQTNPQVTNETGEYSFLVPPGEYYISVFASGYKESKTETFTVTAGQGVHRNIEMVPTGFLRRVSLPWLLLGIVLLSFLLNHFYRDYKKRYYR